MANGLETGSAILDERSRTRESSDRSLTTAATATTSASNLVLGIDPGLNVTGYGVVDVSGPRPKLQEAGVIKSRPSGSLESRLAEIHCGVAEVLAAFQPRCMALEALYAHYERPTTAILMGHARGVICLAAAQAAVPVHHYAATQIKKMLTGNGRAPKPQVQMAICREFGLPQIPEPPDVADALAIALCHIFIAKEAVEGSRLAATRSQQ